MSLIFSTPHGSVLYGLNHVGSDRDMMYVKDTRQKARQRVVGDEDYTTVGLGRFLDLAFSGAHQYLEALFSPVKVYENEAYRPFIESIVVPAAEIRPKYLRTIKHFSYGDTMKRRRHALRLGLALGEMTRYGRFNPRLSVGVAGIITNIAASATSDEIYEAAMEFASSIRAYP